MKQIEAFGPEGETIMDYSIYDAIRAGFGKVVFVIREDFAEQFKAIFEPKLKGRIETAYVYQHLDAHLEGYQRREDRAKPWGTAHAVLCAADVINEPFAVKAYAFLTGACNKNHYSIIGYQLKQTLSDYGTVNRGVCTVNESGDLIGVTERLNIARKDGTVGCDDGLQPAELSEDTIVSMNFWCFDPSVFAYSSKLFQQFLAERGQEEKSEFFIPIVADQFIQDGEGRVEVIPTHAIWFGVTYKNDAPAVKAGIDKLLAEGEYPSGLWH
jgi:hypothetical protein